jgi:hypothetical protein
MIWSKTLDPESPGYKWEEGGVVASSDGVEDCNAIDPGLFLDPTDGRLWMVYVVVRLYPAGRAQSENGKRLNPKETPRNVAINCEAAVLIYRDGWYYLLAPHGSCCRGADSGYNIRMGRAKTVTGPFVEHMGVDMIQGGGKLFLGPGGRLVGPGHFGLLYLGQGVEKFSCHFEADFDRGGASVLDIRPCSGKTAGLSRARTRRKARTSGLAQIIGHADINVAGGPILPYLRDILRRDHAALPREHSARAARRHAANAAASDPPPQARAPFRCAQTAEVDPYAAQQCRRLPRFSVFQDHDRGHARCPRS